MLNDEQLNYLKDKEKLKKERQDKVDNWLSQFEDSYNIKISTSFSYKKDKEK
mgnify:CR=1 FL=1|jgi:hypothetical protein|tara:strand:+ start:386 stop:541 length:156 start_codon:yes stop_codon:yes gene_type:complete